MARLILKGGDDMPVLFSRIWYALKLFIAGVFFMFGAGTFVISIFLNVVGEKLMTWAVQIAPEK